MSTPADFLRLFEEFRADSWDGWRGVLGRLTSAIRELFVVAGRGSGKSRIAAVLACCYASREYQRAPGEDTYIGVFAPDRKQARVTFKYIVGLLRAHPALAALIEDEAMESVTLRTGVVLEVITASRSAPRGRSYALAIVEEAAFLPVDEHAAEPDVELLRALRPALARVPGSLLAVIGSPYARRGVLYQAWRDGDAEDRVVVTGDTLTLNPTFRRREVERAFETDPVAAASEYGRDGVITFRSDVASLLTDAAIAAVVPVGVRELPPDPARAASLHFDAATGSGEDAAAAAVAFESVDDLVIELAAVRRWAPPFSPSAVVKEAAELAASYGISEITIDRFAPGLVADVFSEHGIRCTVMERDTSAAFVELLALINSQRVRLLDVPALLRELQQLERRAGSSGRDIVSHPMRGHDDVAAAAAGALIGAKSGRRQGDLGITF